MPVRISQHDVAGLGRLTIGDDVPVRHLGTAIAAVALVVASGQPLTRHGLGSATGALDLLGMAGSVGSTALRWEARALVAVLASGLVGGGALLFTGALGRAVWWVCSGLVTAVGLVVLVVLRSNAGPATVIMAAAGVVMIGSGLLSSRLSAAPTSQHDHGGGQQHDQAEVDEPPP